MTPNTIYYYFRLCRPPLLILGIIASVGLLAWSGHILSTPESILIILAIVIGNTINNLLNEIHDIDIDKNTHPEKPLPSGKISKQSALTLTCILLIIFSSVIAVLSYYSLVLTFIGILGFVLGIIYNFSNHRALLGNLALGTSYGCAAFMCLYPYTEYYLFAFVFVLFTVAFNLVVQGQDKKGDFGKVETFPIIYTEKNTYIISTMLMILAIILLQFLPLPKFSLHFFILAFAVSAITSSTLSLTTMNKVNFLNEKTNLIIEISNRYLSRIFLILAFTTLILM